MLQICAEFITSHLLMRRNKYLHQPKVFDVLKYSSSQLRKDSKHFGWRAGEIPIPPPWEGAGSGTTPISLWLQLPIRGNPPHFYGYVQNYSMSPKSRSCPIWCYDLCHVGHKSRGDKRGCQCVPAVHGPGACPSGGGPVPVPHVADVNRGVNKATNEGLDDNAPPGAEFLPVHVPPTASPPSLPCR